MSAARGEAVARALAIVAAACQDLDDFNEAGPDGPTMRAFRIVEAAIRALRPEDHQEPLAG
jgi:hypothetical protein